MKILKATGVLAALCTTTHALDLGPEYEEDLSMPDPRIPIVLNFMTNDFASSPFVDVNSTLLSDLEGVPEDSTELGFHPFRTLHKICKKLQDVEDKIKDGLNDAFDELAKTLDEKLPNIEGARCHFHITKLEGCKTWTMTMEEENGGYSYTVSFSPKDFKKALYEVFAGVVNQFETRFEDVDCLSSHKLLRLEAFKHAWPKQNSAPIDDDVPGCAFKFGSSLRLRGTSFDDLGVRHSVRAWKLPCAEGVRARGDLELWKGDAIREPGVCCRPECGFWQWRKARDGTQEYVHACDQRTCLERTPGGAPFKALWESQCCPEAIAKIDRQCKDATDSGCAFPSSSAYANYPGSAKEDAFESDYDAGLYDDKKSFDHDTLHDGYIGALKNLAYNYVDQSDAICNERAVFRLARNKNLYSCDDYDLRSGKIQLQWPAQSSEEKTYVISHCGETVPYAYVHYGNMPQILLEHPPMEPVHYYTLAVIDPDAPAPAEPWGDAPAQREVVHWLVGNIESDAMKNGQNTNGDQLAPTTEDHKWMPPSPPKDGERHRYVVLVYDQGLKPIDFDTQPGAENGGFSVADFAEKYDLKLVGTHYFVSEYGCSEPLQQCGGGITSTVQAEGGGCCNPHAAYWSHDKPQDRGELKFQAPYQCVKTNAPDTTDFFQCIQQESNSTDDGPTPHTDDGACALDYHQCDGSDMDAVGCCNSVSACTPLNDDYSQCIPSNGFVLN